MRFKTAIILAMLALFAIPAWSQSDQYQASANITANFQPQATNSGVTDRATYAAGLLLNFRYRIHNRIWFEGNGAFTTFTQYYTPVAGEEQANIYEGTAAIVYTFRAPQVRLKPFVEAGGGVEFFSVVPSGSTAGGSKVVQPAGLGGVGVDWKINQLFSARVGYRVLFYKPPSFSVTAQTVNTITSMSEPYVGLVLHF